MSNFLGHLAFWALQRALDVDRDAGVRRMTGYDKAKNEEAATIRHENEPPFVEYNPDEVADGS